METECGYPNGRGIKEQVSYAINLLKTKLVLYLHEKGNAKEEDSGSVWLPAKRFGIIVHRANLVPSHSVQP